MDGDSSGNCDANCMNLNTYRGISVSQGTGMPFLRFSENRAQPGGEVFCL